MITPENLAQLINSLDHVVDHPHLYVSDTAPAADVFLAGFQLACSIFGAKDKNYGRAFVEAETEHGWKSLAVSASHQMIARGMSPSEITKEVLSIERDAWKKVQARLDLKKD